MSKIDRIEDRVGDVVAGSLKVAQVALKGAVDFAFFPIVIGTAATFSVVFGVLRAAEEAKDLFLSLYEQLRDEFADALRFFRL